MGRKKLDAYDPPRDPLVSVNVKIRKQLRDEASRFLTDSGMTWSAFLTICLKSALGEASRVRPIRKK